MTKILIAESLDEETLHKVAKLENLHISYTAHPDDYIDSNGIFLTYAPDIKENRLFEYVKNYDGLVVRPKEVSAKTINAANKLKIIIRGGAGINSIDINAAKEKNIIVENTPGQNSVSTAEYAFELIMSLVAKRNILKSHNDSITDCAKDPEKYRGEELAGKKLAIIGMGNVGLQLAKRAYAFDMEVLYYSRNKKDLSYKHFNSVDELLSQGADVVSLHLPLVKETTGFFSERFFSLMKKDSVLINCARPQLIDVAAFKEALDNKIIASAAIDGDLCLIKKFIEADYANKCIFTHHIADSTKQALEKITKAVLSQLLKFFLKGEVINSVY
jgi:phosphoglycerate dehydrogenase-like enzyme